MTEQAYAGRYRWLLVIFMSVAIGCITPNRPTATLPATIPVAEQPTAAPPLGSLTTLRTSVWRIRGSEPIEVAQHHDEEIVENDQIALEEEGHGLLRFQDDLVVELFRGARVEVSNARLEPDGFLIFGLRQVLGTTRAELNAERDARLELQTELATASVSSANGQVAEFITCHKPPPQAVTCLVTVRGAIEVASADKEVTVEAGEGVYVFSDRPLSDPICVVQDEFQAWLEKERKAEENVGLGAVVSRWPQQGCDVEAEATATPEPSLPPAQGMVLIEGGLYEIGASQPDEFHITARQVEVPSFWIDAYEVTNEAYEAFVDATGQPPPDNWPYGSGREKHPVQGVTWDAANAYCQWQSKRLPDEAEWEVAGRGAGEAPPLYPWGPDPFADGQTDQLSYEDTHAVGSVPFTASSFGVYDLVGNVWEWVGEPYAPLEDGLRMLRGGRHGFHRDLAFRQPADPLEPSLLPFAGFRCAAGQVEER